MQPPARCSNHRCVYIDQCDNVGPDVVPNSLQRLTLHLLVLSADNFCKQFGSRSKLFDTLVVFMKEFFEKVDFEKNKQTTKKKKKFPGGSRSSQSDCDINLW